jgi:cell division protein FtsI (penicillin-binding protein 3)
VYDIHLDCCVIEDPRVWEEKSRKLAQEIALVLPERTAPQWWDYFQHARRKKKRYLAIAKNVDLAVLDTLKKLTLLDEPTYKGGRIITGKQMRDYPYGNLARRTIGAGRYMWEEFRFGIENAYNRELTG